MQRENWGDSITKQLGPASKIYKNGSYDEYLQGKKGGIRSIFQQREKAKRKEKNRKVQGSSKEM